MKDEVAAVDDERSMKEHRHPEESAHQRVDLGLVVARP